MLLIAPRKLSCGVIIVNDAAELLLCHVTGHDHWDLPKGGAMPHETPLQAALRETQEETGLALDGSDLLELGRLAYGSRKDLHLYATRMPRFDLCSLRCESRFSCHATGHRLPEMDGFDWVPFADVGRRCTPKMASLLCDRMDLHDLLARLQWRNLAWSPAAPAQALRA